MIVLLMGVSGSGKTTVGEILALRLGCRFLEGDSLHPPANRAKMAGGTPLEDEDRWPWLGLIAGEIDRARAAGEDMVVGCSALKRAYRNILIGDRDDVRLVHLTGTGDLIADRMAARAGHFMPPALLASQLATLEPPTADENALSVDVTADPGVCAASILSHLGRSDAEAVHPER